MGQAIAAHLGSLHPQSASVYDNRAKLLAQRIDSLDNHIQQQLSRAKRRSFAIGHTSLSYFAQDYGLEQIAVEVEQAVLDLNGAYFERQQAEKQVQAQLLAYRVAQRKYQEGLLSVLDLQTTANQLLQARATLLSAELTWQAKRKLVDYYKGVPFLSE